MTERRTQWAPAYEAAICGDCLYTSANGWDERETGRPLPDPAPLGLLDPQALIGWGEDVEPHFSWHACPACGCTLAGDRIDVQIVEPAEAGR